MSKHENSSQRYYVYVLFRETGVPFYVGKGTGDRWNDHVKRKYQTKRKTYKDKIIDKMLRDGHEVRKIKFVEGLSDHMSYLVERALIKCIGRHPNGPLANGTDGGEGHSNPSAEARAKQSARMKGKRYGLGRRHTEEQKRKMSLAKIGNDIGEAGREKLRLANLGKKHSEETKRKVSEAHKGMKFSPEHRANMSKAKRKENLSAETIAKRSAGLRGQKRTAEAREKMRASRLRFLEKQRGIQV